MTLSLKRLAEGVLLYGGAASAAKRLLRRRALILAYHNILPDGVGPLGDRVLHLSRRRFADQLDFLARHYEVVPLRSLLSNSHSGRPRVAITFDDAYAGAVRFGVIELARRGLPGTIFVAPSFLGGRMFWWDELANAYPRGLPEILRERALKEHKGRDGAIRVWAYRFGCRPSALPEYARTANEEDLAELVGRSAITLGAHSWSHPNLTRLTEPELRRELTEPIRWLAERFSNFIPWLAYPYGHSSPDVERAVAAAGYEAALLIDGGWLRCRHRNIFAVPRLSIASTLSLNGFKLRLAGLLFHRYG